MSEGRIPGSFELVSESTDAVLTKFILSSPGAHIQQTRASEATFLGWQVVGGIPRPASAIVVEQPADDSWAVAVWSLDDGRPGTPQLTEQPAMSSWDGPEEWTIVLPLESGSVRVLRKADRVSVADEAAKDADQLILKAPTPVDSEIRALRSAHERALARYPKFSDHMDYRAKATYLCILLFLFQEAFFAVYRRHSTKHYTLLRGLSVLGWAGMGIWLVVIRAPLIASWPL
jgi:hypothetical protein